MQWAGNHWEEGKGLQCSAPIYWLGLGAAVCNWCFPPNRDLQWQEPSITC
jgi:hypothetical protein